MDHNNKQDQKNPLEVYRKIVNEIFIIVIGVSIVDQRRYLIPFDDSGNFKGYPPFPEMFYTITLLLVYITIIANWRGTKTSIAEQPETNMARIIIDLLSLFTFVILIFSVKYLYLVVFELFVIYLLYLSWHIIRRYESYKEFKKEEQESKFLRFLINEHQTSIHSTVLNSLTFCLGFLALFFIFGIFSNQNISNPQYTRALPLDFLIWFLSLVMIVSYELRLAGKGWSWLIHRIN